MLWFDKFILFRLMQHFVRWKCWVTVHVKPPKVWRVHHIILIYRVCWEVTRVCGRTESVQTSALCSQTDTHTHHLFKHPSDWAAWVIRAIGNIFHKIQQVVKYSCWTFKPTLSENLKLNLGCRSLTSNHEPLVICVITTHRLNRKPHGIITAVFSRKRNRPDGNVSETFGAHI